MTQPSPSTLMRDGPLSLMQIRQVIRAVHAAAMLADGKIAQFSVSQMEGLALALQHVSAEMERAHLQVAERPSLDRAAQVEPPREFTNTREPHRQTVPAEAVPGDGVRSPECHGLDTPERVCFYEQDFYVLSNFSAFSVEWRGITFATAEAAYHWERFRSEDGQSIRNMIYNAKSAHEAFKIAQANKIDQCTDWDAIKVDVMRDILRAKANQHEYVKRKLLATGDRELVENSWRDDFWGWGPNRDGQNMLGKLWMEVRKELRDGAAPSASQEPGEVPRGTASGETVVDSTQSNPTSRTISQEPQHKCDAEDGYPCTVCGKFEEPAQAGGDGGVAHSPKIAAGNPQPQASAPAGSVIAGSGLEQSAAGVAPGPSPTQTPERAPEQEGCWVETDRLEHDMMARHVDGKSGRYWIDHIFIPLGPLPNNPGYALVKLTGTEVDDWRLGWSKGNYWTHPSMTIDVCGDRLSAALSAERDEARQQYSALSCKFTDLQRQSDAAHRDCSHWAGRATEAEQKLSAAQGEIERLQRLCIERGDVAINANSKRAQSEAGAALMRPVVEAAKAWRGPTKLFYGDAISNLQAAVDAYTAATKGGEK